MEAYLRAELVGSLPGKQGVEKILKMTMELHADKVSKEDELVGDTTVQEANVKFPTDTRLYVDCIEKLWEWVRQSPGFAVTYARCPSCWHDYAPEATVW